MGTRLQMGGKSCADAGLGCLALCGSLMPDDGEPRERIGDPANLPRPGSKKKTRRVRPIRGDFPLMRIIVGGGQPLHRCNERTRGHTAVVTGTPYSTTVGLPCQTPISNRWCTSADSATLSAASGCLRWRPCCCSAIVVA